MDEPFAAVDAATENAIIQMLRKMKEDGRTSLVIHHDLQTVPSYFDHVILLNMRVVADGPVQDVFNEDNLQKTYGGRLTLLDEVSEAMRRPGAFTMNSRIQILSDHFLEIISFHFQPVIAQNSTTWDFLKRLILLEDYNTRVVLLGTAMAECACRSGWCFLLSCVSGL